MTLEQPAGVPEQPAEPAGVPAIPAEPAAIPAGWAATPAGAEPMLYRSIRV